MMMSSHLSEPHVPQTNNSCLLCAGNDTHDNLPMACSGQCHLTQSKQLNCVSFSCTFLPKNPLVIKLLNCSSLALVRPNGKLRPLLFYQTLLVYHLWSPVVVCFVYALKQKFARLRKQTLQGEHSLPRHKSLQRIIVRVGKCFHENKLLSHPCYVVDTVVAFY